MPVVRWVMCRSSGEFTRATTAGDAVEPLIERCSACGGRVFEHTATDTVIDTGE